MHPPRKSTIQTFYSLLEEINNSVAEIYNVSNNCRDKGIFLKLRELGDFLCDILSHRADTFFDYTAICIEEAETMCAEEVESNGAESAELQIEHLMNSIRVDVDKLIRMDFSGLSLEERDRLKGFAEDLHAKLYFVE